MKTQSEKQKPILTSVTEEELDALISERLMQSETLQCTEQEDKAEDISLFMDEEEFVGATTEEVSISVAIDSGAVDNAVHPDELPCDAEPEANKSGRHFVGAKGERIEKYGTCTTMLEGDHGQVGCKWQLADVTRPLHSLSTIAGPPEGPGHQDVIFNNRLCAVVPPGVVDEILKKVKPVARYDRKGHLYAAEMKMRSFGRQGSRA